MARKWHRYLVFLITAPALVALRHWLASRKHLTGSSPSSGDGGGFHPSTILHYFFCCLCQREYSFSEVTTSGNIMLLSSSMDFLSISRSLCCETSLNKRFRRFPRFLLSTLLLSDVVSSCLPFVHVFQEASSPAQSICTANRSATYHRVVWLTCFNLLHINRTFPALCVSQT